MNSHAERTQAALERRNGCSPPVASSAWLIAFTTFSASEQRRRVRDLVWRGWSKREIAAAVGWSLDMVRRALAEPDGCTSGVHQ